MKFTSLTFVMSCSLFLQSELSFPRMSHKGEESKDVTRRGSSRGGKPRGRLSGKGGAAVLKSLSLFLAKKSARTAAEDTSRPTDMNDTTNNTSKYLARLVETLKRDTHFTK